MELVRLNPRRIDEIADRIAAALESGCVAAPLLGGYCVLSRRPEWLQEQFGAAFRVVEEISNSEFPIPDSAFNIRHSTLALSNAEYREKVVKVMVGPVAGLLEPPGERSGVALALEPLARAVLERSAESLWLGVPEEAADAAGLEEDLGEDLVLGIDDDDAPGPGPTVVRFSSRPAVVDRRGKLAILDLEHALGETVKLGPGVLFSILVVCTGNSCRSPMAQGVLAKLLEGERVFVYSAGTGAPVGNPATRFAREAVAGLGVDLSSHRAQQLSAAAIRNADLVLVMEEYHREQVVGLAPDAASRTKLLLDYATGERAGREVADPIGRSLEFYQQTAAGMEEALEQVAAEVKQRL